MKKYDYSIIIPVFQNEGTLFALYEEIKTKIIFKNKKLSGEIIFVDDGSEDKSYKKLIDIKNSDDNINCKVIKLTRNFGQGAAIFAGYKHSKGSCMINLAADLQDPPEVVDKMLKYYFSSNYDAIIPVRRSRDDYLYRKVGSYIFYWIIKKLSFKNIPLSGFDFYLLDEKVVKFMLNSNDSDPFMQGQILWSGYKTKFINYDRAKRANGDSKHTFSKLLKFFIDAIMNYSFFPIRLMSYAGFMCSSIGFICGLWILISRLAYGPGKAWGWASLMIVILIIGGIQMIMLGIIGEYVWRTLSQTRKRPQYIIDEISNKKQNIK